MCPEKKRRHHYVWRHYLEAWAPHGRIVCHQDGKVFFTSPVNVAVKKDFYRLRELSAADLHFLRAAIDTAAADTLRRTNTAWVRIFTGVFALRDLMESKDLRHSELHDQIETAIQNLEEDLHGSIESDTTAHLAALRSGNMRFLEADADRALFLHFLAVQMFRSRKGQERVLETTKEVVESPAAPVGINMEAVWPVLRHVLATNVGFYLYMHWDSVRCRLLRTPNRGEFITADQPVLNLAADWAPSLEPPDEVDLLYPVSPQHCLRLELDHSTPGCATDVATTLELDWWNQRIFRERGTQAFATNEALLATLAKAEQLG